jgi:hypothetical protein
MNISISRIKSPFSLLIILLLSSATLVSCASAALKNQSAQAPAPHSIPAPLADSAAKVNEATSSSLQTLSTAQFANGSQSPRMKTQLVKTAELGLVVKSVTDGIRSVTTVIENQQGDLLGLQDSPSADAGSRHRATVQIRVPQDRLEVTLDALSRLGTVQRQSLSAEDVADQLVDFQARLRNLQKTESTLLQIMDRSGSVADVLKVSEALSRTRQESEQMTAQLTNLKNRVAYSQISLSMEEVLATSQPDRPLGSQLQETWNRATHSVADLTLGFGKLGIWLIAYTPYWLALGILLIWINKRWKLRTAPQEIQPGNPQPS